MNIRSVLEKMIAAHASDLHLKAGTPPVVRVDGVLYTLDEPPPSSAELREVGNQLLNEEQRLYISTHNEIDFAFGVSGLARFRANIFMQRGTTALALRHVPVEDHECLVDYVIARCLLSESKVEGAEDYKKFRVVVEKASNRRASVDRTWSMRRFLSPLASS